MAANIDVSGVLAMAGKYVAESIVPNNDELMFDKPPNENSRMCSCALLGSTTTLCLIRAQFKDQRPLLVSEVDGIRHIKVDDHLTLTLVSHCQSTLWNFDLHTGDDLRCIMTELAFSLSTDQYKHFVPDVNNVYITNKSANGASGPQIGVVLYDPKQANNVGEASFENLGTIVCEVMSKYAEINNCTFTTSDRDAASLFVQDSRKTKDIKAALAHPFLISHPKAVKCLLFHFPSDSTEDIRAAIEFVVNAMERFSHSKDEFWVKHRQWLEALFQPTANKNDIKCWRFETYKNDCDETMGAFAEIKRCLADATKCNNAAVAGWRHQLANTFEEPNVQQMENEATRQNAQNERKYLIFHLEWFFNKLFPNLQRRLSQMDDDVLSMIHQRDTPSEPKSSTSDQVALRPHSPAPAVVNSPSDNIQVLRNELKLSLSNTNGLLMDTK